MKYKDLWSKLTSKLRRSPKIEISTPSPTPTPDPIPVEPYVNGARIGWRLPVISTAETYSAEQFIYAYFKHYRSVELQIPLNRWSEYGLWLLKIDCFLNDHPNIAAVLHFSWDMADQQQISCLKNVLSLLKSIHNVGCDGTQMLHPTIDRYRQTQHLIESFNYRFVNYRSDAYDPQRNYCHINYNSFPSSGAMRNWTVKQLNDIGISAGIYGYNRLSYDAVPLNDTYEYGLWELNWSEELMRAYVTQLLQLNIKYIHFCGLLKPSFIGASSIRTNHMWDHPTVQSWINRIHEDYEVI